MNRRPLDFVISELEPGEDPRQMKFSDLEFRFPHKDFVEAKSTSAYDYSAWVLHKELPYEKKSQRYFFYSIFLHLILGVGLTALTALTVPLLAPPVRETITFDLLDSETTPGAAAGLSTNTDSASSSSSETLMSTPVASTSVAPLPTPLPQIQPKEEAPVSVSAPNPSVAAKKVVSPVKTEEINEPLIALKPIDSSTNLLPVPPKKRAQQKAAEKSQTQVTPSPETLEDIPTPALDEKIEPQKAEIEESEITPSLTAVAKENSNETEQAVKDEAEALNSATQALEKEHQNQVQELAQQNKKEAEALQKWNQARKEQEAQARAAAVAAATASEKEAVAQGSNGPSTSDHGVKSKEGAGSLNSNSGGVRSLGDLRQRPGNPKPQYDPPERLRGDRGDVVFLAYITKDGSTTNFRLMQSSGFRNLDLKTLKALKQWKFYAGQEGWVELPFRWDLSGGPREMPALLRRAQ